MSCILQVFCIFLSALLLSLGIPNEIYLLGSPVFGFIALVPLYLVFASSKSYRDAFAFMGLHAGATHLMSSYWLAYFKDFAALTLGASALGTAVLGGLCGLFFYIPFSRYGGPGNRKSNFSRNKIYFPSLRIFWFALCYVTYEWVKSTGFLAYPWGTLYQTTYHFKIFTQIADITGVYGITFLMACFSALLGEFFILWFSSRTEEEKILSVFSVSCTALTIGTLFAVSFIYGIFQYTKDWQPEKIVNTIMVQQNADPWTLSSDDSTILVSERLTEAKLAEAKSNGFNVDLVVWSEGCLKYRFPRSKTHYQHYPKEHPLIPFIQKTGIPFLLGGSYAPEYSSKHFNGALLFDPEGNFRGAYPKNHLVPLAEAVPFSDIKAVAAFFKKAIGISAGWSAGDKYTMFRIPCSYPEEKLLEISKIVSLEENFTESSEEKKPFVTFSAPICYDDAFPDVCRPLVKYGSDFFMNITDDSWSKKESAEYQHFVISYFRAVEQRTTLARSTNAGYSVVINPAGKIVMEMPLFKEHAEFVQIPVYKKQATLYQKAGNWLPGLAFLSILASMCASYAERNKILAENSERKKFRNKKKSKKSDKINSKGK